MQFLAPNKRVGILWLVSILVWTIALLLTRLPIIPCQIFVFDSDQGYYQNVCPLLDEDGHLLLQTDDSGFSGIPNQWTWPMLILLLVIFPYLDAVILDRVLTNLQHRQTK